MSRLCCLFRAYLSLFSSCKPSDRNSRSCSSLCFYSQCHFHPALYVFLSLQIFLLLFSQFLSFLFFVFDIRLSFLIICFGATFTYFKSLYFDFKKLRIFRELFISQDHTFDFLPCFWLASTVMRLVKWSPRLRAVPANSSQFLEVVSYIVPYGFSFLISTSTFKYTLARHSCHRMNALFLIPRNDRPKLTKDENKISLQVF